MNNYHRSALVQSIARCRGVRGYVRHIIHRPFALACTVPFALLHLRLPLLIPTLTLTLQGLNWSAMLFLITTASSFKNTLCIRKSRLVFERV